jgi:serine/threonine protein kinase
MKINLKQLDIAAIEPADPEALASEASPRQRRSPSSNAALAQLKTRSGDDGGSSPRSNRSDLKRTLEKDDDVPGPAAAKRQRRPDLPSPKSHDTGASSGTASGARPAPTPYRKWASFMDAARRPVKPRVPADPSRTATPDQLLRAARKYTRQGSSDQMLFDTLSPSLVARLNELPIKSTLASAIAAMKPGVAQTSSGFRDVRLAGSPRTRAAQPLKEPLGRGRFGTAYAVTLAENLIRNGKDLGREFVFKALLRSDPENPVPVDLYAGLRGDEVNDPAAREAAIQRKKQQIVDEFQITSALTKTAHVMQVYDLVRIDDEFGILCEKINGENIGGLVKKSRAALEALVINERDYLDLVKQAIADILIAIARCEDEGVTHSDISPNNVMYDADEKMFKLIDMGNGREVGQRRPPGTPGYTDISTSVADHKSDIYGVGQLLAHFVKSATTATGITGFSAESLTLDDFPFLDDLQYLPSTDRDEILDVARRMIQQPPESRPSSIELLRHRFFAQLAPRDQTHLSYEKSERWHRSESISSRFTACYPHIEDVQARDAAHNLLLGLNEMWQDDQQRNRQADIEERLKKLGDPSVRQLLDRAENLQSGGGGLASTESERADADA